MRTFDAEHLKHGRLRFEDCSATDSADLDRGHRDTDLQVAVVTIRRLARFY